MPDEMCKPKAMGLNVNNKIMWENGDSGIFYMFIKTLNLACVKHWERPSVLCTVKWTSQGVQPS